MQEAFSGLGLTPVVDPSLRPIVGLQIVWNTRQVPGGNYTEGGEGLMLGIRLHDPANGQLGPK